MSDYTKNRSQTFNSSNGMWVLRDTKNGRIVASKKTPYTCVIRETGSTITYDLYRAKLIRQLYIQTLFNQNSRN